VLAWHERQVGDLGLFETVLAEADDGG